MFDLGVASAWPFPGDKLVRDVAKACRCLAPPLQLRASLRAALLADSAVLLRSAAGRAVLGDGRVGQARRHALAPLAAAPAGPDRAAGAPRTQT